MGSVKEFCLGVLPYTSSRGQHVLFINLNGFWDGRQVAIQLLFCSLLRPGFVFLCGSCLTLSLGVSCALKWCVHIVVLTFTAWKISHSLSPLSLFLYIYIYIYIYISEDCISINSTEIINCQFLDYAFFKPNEKQRKTVGMCCTPVMYRLYRSPHHGVCGRVLMPPFIFPHGLRFNTEANVKCLEKVEFLWIERVAA